MFDRFFLKLLAKPGLSRTTARFADTRWPGPVLRTFLRSYIRHYGVDLEEVQDDLSAFKTFNEFFTRALKDGARPIAGGEGTLLSPSDGLVVAAEDIGEDGQIGQIKGTTYSLDSLLNDSQLAQTYVGGKQITIYLSPRDYHRVHAPLSGRVTRISHIAGRCFPVNEWAASHIENLYGLNERVLIEMQTTAYGHVGLVMVGAANVARISLAFHELQSNNKSDGDTIELDGITLEGGEELGRFNLGSTVVLLLPKNDTATLACSTGDTVKMGQALGTIA
jgi:phosphatidylserine decarboxylase